jgi:hypothetical protein
MEINPDVSISKASIGNTMSITNGTDQELKEEALAILAQYLPAHKISRLISAWQMGQGDYAKDRAELFANETVASLFEEAQKNYGK